MKSSIQVLRQPIKLLAGILLLTLAGGMLCASVSQYLTAVFTRQKVERDYTTIALVTNKYSQEPIYNEDGDMTGMMFSSGPPASVSAFLNNLPEEHPDIIKQVDRCGVVSAYCPKIIPIYPAQILPANENVGSVMEAAIVPGNTAVLAITLENIEPATVVSILDLSSVFCKLTGRIDQVVSLQEGYDDPTGYTLKVDMILESEEELDRLGLETGASYLIYGQTYIDNNWRARRGLASASDEMGGFDTEFYKYMDLSRLRMLSPQDQEYYRLGEMAVYENPDKTCLFVSPMYLDMVCSSSVNVSSNIWAGRSMAEPISIKRNGEYTEVSKEEFAQLYQMPDIARLTGTVEEFLDSPEGELWRVAMDDMQINNHAFPVLAVEHLGSMVQFARQETFISQGRSFNSREYEKGARVCILSETLAAVNNLSVGDKIPLALYSDDQHLGTDINTANPSAAPYSHVQGFETESEEYEIIGLYRQTNEWSDDIYAFTPNTIFVPAAAVSCEKRQYESGIFQTMVLRNGTVPDMEEILVQAGYPELLVCYDQGYSNIKEQLEEYFSVSLVVLLAGLGAWMILFFLFLLLYPLSQRKSVVRMWHLGATPSQVMAHVVVSSMDVAVPGCVLGGLLGYEALKRAISLTELEVVAAIWAVPVLAVLQLAVCLTGCVFCGRHMQKHASGKGN